MLEVITPITYNCGGDIDELTSNKSCPRRHRATSRRNQVKDIKGNFDGTVGLTNFSGRLLQKLQGFSNIKLLAVVLVQEEDNKLICTVETKQGE